MRSGRGKVIRFKLFSKVSVSASNFFKIFQELGSVCWTEDNETDKLADGDTGIRGDGKDGHTHLNRFRKSF